MGNSWETRQAVAPQAVAGAVAVEYGGDAFFVQAVGFALWVISTGSQANFKAGHAQQFAV